MSGLLLSLLLASAVPADQPVFIVVRPGDTPESIAELYLQPGEGSEELLLLNHPLNPNRMLELPAASLRGEHLPRVVSVTGAAVLIPRDQEEEIPLREGAALEAGDAIRPFLHGSVGLRFTGDKILILGGPGRLEVLEPGEGNDLRLGLASGCLEARWSTTAGKPGVLRVEAGPLGVNCSGGRFRVRAVGGGQVFLEVLEGEANAEIDGGKRSVPAGFGLTAFSRHGGDKK